MSVFEKGTINTVKPAEQIDNVLPIKPQTSSRLLGIDVSHYEPPVNWEKARAGGVKFMYTKATEGAGHIDKYLRVHADAAKSAGVLNGAYHFFHASIDGLKQAELYLQTVAGMSLDLPHCLDWEGSSGDGLPANAQKLEAKKWLDRVEKATGRVPMIYGGESHLREMGLGPEFERYPLWLAHYGVRESQLRLPQPWKKFTIWQYTDKESVAGLAAGHHVDANWFNGSLDDLRRLAGV